MSGCERLDSKAGPLGNLSQTYYGSLDMMAKGFEPALKGVGRWNLELIGLLTRRSQAWLEMPARLGQCRTFHHALLRSRLVRPRTSGACSICCLSP